MDVFECTHKGDVTIGNKTISCAVLNNGKRIITQTALFDAFDRPRKGEKRLEGLPSIIGAKNLLPFVTDEIREIATPIHYYLQNGKVSAGYDANLIPIVCEIYLQAHDSGLLLDSQQRIANQASILVRALARVGITALVDEATGFQYDRENDALQSILKAYISEEFLKWQRRFPRKYYQEVYRLYGWDFNPQSMKHSPYLGRFTSEYVYDYLPDGVLEELRIKNPKNENGVRSKKHHQYLTGDIGIPHLEKHITKLITVMELSDSPEQFKHNFKRIFNKSEQIEMNI
ncbi:P63C domain-containing protein [Plesiomonas shigelloides]|uniref:P63C domain-containing protein n=1 Tax=Plesiomonas shigelloides TaxID=703 RepID=UPI0022455A6D|nr:P63C domain-containing protein [Plesiomonas shigelloides]MCX2499471.1 P63C domain-containing protein [Plesiomonas shigelloides]